MFLEEEVAAIANSYKVFRGDAGKEVRALGARGERLERTMQEPDKDENTPSYPTHWNNLHTSSAGRKDRRRII